MGASAMTWEIRAGRGVEEGVRQDWAQGCFFFIAHAEDTRGERIFDPETRKAKT